MEHFLTTSEISNIKWQSLAKLFMFLFASMIIANLEAQTTFTVIDPSGDGGFETSSAQFPSNGWTAVQASTNRWNVGTASFSGGIRGAYITNAATLAAAAANTYTNTTANTSHIYRSIAIPAGATNITLSFKLKTVGEASNWDQLLVWYGAGVPVVNTPVGQTTTMAGFTNIFTSNSTTTYASFQTVTVNNALPAGTVNNLVFTWKNDGSAGSNPPAGIDEVFLTYQMTIPVVVGSITGTTTLSCGATSALSSPVPSATGGTVISSGDIRMNIFTSGGTFTPNFAGNVEAMVVGGGGGGGVRHAGGGGAGGMSYNASLAVSGAQTITVGSGGGSATSGSSSSIGSILTALGGGFGSSNGAAAGIGGSGGGGSNGAAGANGTAGQGNKGGNHAACCFANGCGGGGAGAAGANTSGAVSSDGGTGIYRDITGSVVAYAGGGGGGKDGAAAQAGGIGGGGTGGTNISPWNGGNGTANTGGGGGGGGASGGSSGNGGTGGSGIVAIRYLVPTSLAWSSGNTSVATVNASTGVVTPVSNGTAVITCIGTNGVQTAATTTTVTVSGYPTHDGVTVSSNCWITDNTNDYTITAKATGSTPTDIGGNTYGMLALINFQGGNTPNYGGYFAWNTTQALLTSAGYTLEQQACTGGGWIGKASTYGGSTISLISGSTTVSGNQRTVNFVVRPNNTFPKFTNNSISQYAQNTSGCAVGWTETANLFTSSPARPTSGIVTVNGDNTPANTIQLCPGATIAVSQSGWNNQSGTTYFFSDNTTGFGGWAVVPEWEIIDNGNITAANQVAGQTGVNNLSSFNYKINNAGIYILHTNANYGNCYTTNGGVNRYININPTPSNPTSVTPSVATNGCAGSFNLSAVSNGGTIRWYDASNTFLGSSASGANFPVTLALGSPVTFYAEGYNATTGCSSTGKTATGLITVIPAPLSVNPGVNVSICNGGGIGLNATAVTTNSVVQVLNSASNTADWQNMYVTDANRWTYNNTSNAGGSSTELNFNYYANGNTSNPYIVNNVKVDARSFTNLNLSFKHLVSWYSGSFTLRFETSTDGATWTSRWTQTFTASLAATTVNQSLSALNGTSFFYRFIFVGNTTNINDWYIDDISITGQSTTLATTYSWSPATGLSATNIANPIASPASTQTYTVTASVGSCTVSNSVVVSVSNLAMTGSTSVCIGATSDLDVTGAADWNVLPTGGTITSSGDDKIHTFTANGTFTPSIAIGNASYIIAGGGGGGGGNGGGGGGAGRFISRVKTSLPASALAVVIGGGGTGSTSGNVAGTNGGNSSFNSLIAVGGGGGASRDAGNAASDGGCGGGGSGTTLCPRNLGGLGETNKGGNGTGPDQGVNAAGGGGGGEGGVGVNAVNNIGGNGGAGVSNNISGASVNYCAGGGGGVTTTNVTRGTGGSSSTGGNGGGNATLPTSGATNSGSGGGGAGQLLTSGGNGADGVVVIRYTVPKWTSSNLAVASVDATTGLVTGISAGTTTITYYNELGCSVATTVTVGATTASISPSSVNACIGGAATTLTASGGGTYSWSNSGGSAAAASFSPTKTTTYTVTVTNSGCSATATRTIRVPEVKIPALTGTQTICQGATTTFGMPFTAATGGTVTSLTGYKVHTFTSGTANFNSPQDLTAEVLIVGGGGSGGPAIGGGGGGGGVVYIPSVDLAASTNYAAVVGAGGATSSTAAGNDGVASTMLGATAAGGGTSGRHDAANGTTGGNGGGAASNNTVLNIGGTSSGNSLGSNVGTIFGNSGGSMLAVRTGGPTRAAGGGGAGARAGNVNSNYVGAGSSKGGDGIQIDINGTAHFWGGGGGGGTYFNGNGGNGGLGGGGGGGESDPAGSAGIGGGSALATGSTGSVGGNQNGGAGAANTGGGGGGGTWSNGLGGAGGSGIVIVRYPDITGGVWTSDDITVATVNSSTGVVTGVNAGTTNINYNVVILAGCTTKVSRSITVNATSAVGAVSADQTICTGTAPANITLASATGTILWSQADANFNTNVTTKGGNSTTLTSAQIGTLAATKYYRATVTNGVCPAINSGVVTVNVNAQPSAGTVTSSPAAGPLCAGTNVTASVSGGAGGAGTITDVLQYSSNGGAWTTYSGAVTAATSSLQFRTYRTASTSGCTTSGINTATSIVVNAQPTGPTINVKTPNTANICAGQTVSATFNTGTAGTGCSDDFTVSIDGGAATSYTPGVSVGGTATSSIVIQGRRASCTSGAGCTGTSYVTLASWTVAANPSAPTSSGNPEACYRASVPNHVVAAGAGETADWFDAASGGSLVKTGSLTFNEAIDGSGPNPLPGSYTYYAEARNTTTGCKSATRTQVDLVIRSVPIIGPTATPGTACSGDAVVLAANATAPAGYSITTYAWSSGLAGNVSGGTVNPTSTTTYTVTVTNNYTCTNSADASVTVRTGAAFVVLPSSTVTTAVEQCTDGGWTYYANASNPDNWIFAIDKNGNSFTAQADITILGSRTSVDNINTSIAGYEHGSYLMTRYWNASVLTGNISTSVNIRFFYDPSELSAALSARDAAWASYPSTTKTPLRWFKTVGVPFDAAAIASISGNSFNGFSNISLTPASSGTTNGVTYVQFDGITSFSGGTAGYGFSSPGTGLPVKLINFTATAIENRYVRLDWSTATEVDNMGFEVERSTDGTNFTKIGWVKGNDNSTQRIDYSFDDRDAELDVRYYYRLKQIDNGNVAFEYSNIASAILISDAKSYVGEFVPNPAKTKSVIDILSLKNQEVVLRVVDATGKLIRNQVLQLNKGFNNLAVEVADLADATYVVSFTFDDTKVIKRLVVTK